VSLQLADLGVYSFIIHSDQRVSMRCGDRDDRERHSHFPRLVDNGPAHPPAQIEREGHGWALELGLGEAAERKVFAGRRRSFVGARRVDSMIVAAEPARIAR
jgi:hypothetical protein